MVGQPSPAAQAERAQYFASAVRGLRRYYRATVSIFVQHNPRKGQPKLVNVMCCIMLGPVATRPGSLDK